MNTTSVLAQIVRATEVIVAVNWCVQALPVYAIIIRAWVAVIHLTYRFMNAVAVRITSIVGATVIVVAV
jgi:hypothetical protein